MGKRKREPPAAPDEPPRLNTPFSGLADLARGLPEGPSSRSAGDGEGPAPEPSRTWPGKVVLRHERTGRGGKTVTIVAGVPAASRERVAVELKRALGCGAVVEADEIVLLGSVAERAAAWLRERGAPRVFVGN